MERRKLSTESRRQSQPNGIVEMNNDSHYNKDRYNLTKKRASPDRKRMPSPTKKRLVGRGHSRMRKMLKQPEQDSKVKEEGNRAMREALATSISAQPDLQSGGSNMKNPQISNAHSITQEDTIMEEVNLVQSEEEDDTSQQKQSSKVTDTERVHREEALEAGMYADTEDISQEVDEDSEDSTEGSVASNEESNVENSSDDGGITDSNASNDDSGSSDSSRTNSGESKEGVELDNVDNSTDKIEKMDVEEEQQYLDSMQQNTKDSKEIKDTAEHEGQHSQDSDFPVTDDTENSPSLEVQTSSKSKKKKASFDESRNTQHENTSFYETQDDDNTVNSDQTTHNMTQKELDKVQELSSTRYMFNFLLEQLDIAKLKRDFGTSKVPKELKDPILRVKEVIKKLFTRMKEIDNMCKLLKWNKNKGDASIDDPENLPNDVVELESYFEGFRPNRKAGRVSYYWLFGISVLLDSSGFHDVVLLFHYDWCPSVFYSYSSTWSM